MPVLAIAKTIEMPEQTVYRIFSLLYHLKNTSSLKQTRERKPRRLIFLST
jgi:hypothetical protein